MSSKRVGSLVGGVVCLVLASVSLNSAALAGPEHAPWHAGSYWGLGAQWSYPQGDFRNEHSPGYGLQAALDYPLVPLLDLSGSVGWNHFPRAHTGAGVDIWEVTAGGRFALGAFFMNGEAGYFSKGREWGFVPGLGLRYTHWEVSLRTKVAGVNTWGGLRVVYFF